MWPFCCVVVVFAYFSGRRSKARAPSFESVTLGVDTLYTLTHSHTRTHARFGGEVFESNSNACVIGN